MFKLYIHEEKIHLPFYLHSSYTRIVWIENIFLTDIHPCLCLKGKTIAHVFPLCFDRSEMHTCWNSLKMTCHAFLAGVMQEITILYLTVSFSGIIWWNFLVIVQSIYMLTWMSIALACHLIMKGQTFAENSVVVYRSCIERTHLETLIQCFVPDVFPKAKYLGMIAYRICIIFFKEKITHTCHTNKAKKLS